MNIKKFIQNVYHPRGGLVSHLRKIDVKPGLPQIIRYLAVINSNRLRGGMITGSGFSIDHTSSKMAAIGEAVERYCANIENQKTVLGSYEEFEGYAMDPMKITRLTDEQYSRNPNLNKVTTKSILEWCNGVDLISGETVLIPKELIYLTNNQKPIRDIISTGLACSDTKEDAISRGLLECIERDAFVLFWMLGIVNFKIDFTDINNQDICKLISLAKHSDLQIELYDISQEFSVTTILSVIRKKDVKGFYLGCAAHYQYSKAILNSIKEGLGGYSVFYEYLNYYDFNYPSKMEEIETLDDHALYYISGQADWVLEGLLPSTLPIKLANELLDKQTTLDITLDKLNEQEYIPYAVDLTTIDVKSIGLNVMRVVVPALAFLPVGEPMLNCPRLHQKKALSNKEFNLLPHPFP
ncbi:YcaO-like family protein [Ureibacillus sp. MALMAid1270]|uniref:YcaO-like family protein n=1 Tax=Ureibacillus sp. MALMAid1270 TaxID=3411629 RepID=UPI003BA4FB27